MRRFLERAASHLAFWLVILFAVGIMTLCVWLMGRVAGQREPLPRSGSPAGARQQ